MQFNFTFLKNFLAFVEVFKKPSVFTFSCFTFQKLRDFGHYYKEEERIRSIILTRCFSLCKTIFLMKCSRVCQNLRCDKMTRIKRLFVVWSKLLEDHRYGQQNAFLFIFSHH